MSNNLKQWEHPDSYFGATWEGYYVFLGQHRDSDCLERSNFRAALAAIGGESETEGGVQVVREGHWAVGWVEWIAIPPGPSVALAKAIEIHERLEDYPVLDEEDFSEAEQEEANEVWKHCYDREERVDYIRNDPDQFWFRDWSEVRSVIAGEYFIGYACELLG